MIDMLYSLVKYGALNTVQFNILHFTGYVDQVSSQCVKSCRAAFDHELIDRLKQIYSIEEGEPIMSYCLTKKGFDILKEERHIVEEWNAEKYTFKSAPKHLIASNYVRIAVDLSGVELVKWYTPGELHKISQEDSIGIIPDGMMIVRRNGTNYHFFIEADRSTIPLGRWRSKIALYIQWWTSGKYEARFGTKDMRILTVTTTKAHALNMKAATEEASGRSRFLFTTFDELTGELFTKSIWLPASQSEPRAIFENAVTPAIKQPS